MDSRSGYTADGQFRWTSTNCVYTLPRTAANTLTASSVPKLQRPTTISLNHSFGCKPELHELLAKFTLYCLRDTPAVRTPVGAHCTRSRSLRYSSVKKTRRLPRDMYIIASSNRMKMPFNTRSTQAN